MEAPRQARTDTLADRSLNRDAGTLDPTLWGHRWGFEDTKLFLHPDGSVEMTGERYNLCGYRMPYLVPFINKELGVEIDFTATRPLTEAPRSRPPHATRTSSPRYRRAAPRTSSPPTTRNASCTATDRPPPKKSHGCCTRT